MALSSEHLDAYMVTWKLEREFGGMTTVCTQRAGLFAQRYGRAFVVTFSRSPEQPQIVAELVDKGKLSDKVQVLNLYLELAENSMPGQNKVPERAFEPQVADLKLEDTVTYPEAPQNIFSQSFTGGPDGSTSQTKFLRKDGSVFLTDTKFLDERGKNRRILEVMATDGKVIARFNSAPALYRYWLGTITDHENSMVIVDSKYTASMLGRWETTKVPKLYAFHSIHISKGESLLTGELSEAHAPIIEQRNLWDGFVFLTQAQRDAYVRRFGDADTSFVIPNPIKANTLTDSSIQRESNHLIAAGSLTVNKNVAASIQVIAELVRRGHQPVLHVVGQGAQREKLEALCQELQLEEHVIFHGYSNELPAHFAHCTAQLFTSTNEGQALVLLEAQQQGCVPVSFDINFGPSDSIRDGVNGFLVAPGDIQAMADKAEALMTDPQLATTMSKQCREFAHNYASRDLIARWEETMNIAAKLKALGSRKEVPEFTAHIASVSFLDDDGLELRVQPSVKLPEGTSFELVVLDRETQDEVQVYPSSGHENEHAVFTLDADMVRGAVGHNEPTDLYLRCQLGQSVKLKRIGVKNSRILPYFTSHNNLSFKPEK